MGRHGDDAYAAEVPPGPRRRRRGAHAAPSRFPASWVLGVSLALVNVFLLGADLIRLRAARSGRPLGLFADSRWAGSLDGSYSELAGHGVLLVAAVLLVLVWRERRAAVYGVWALVLGVIVADDFLLLHERLGGMLVREFGLPAIAGLRPQDLGELLVWAVPMAVLGAALLVAHLRARGLVRRHSWTLIALMAALVGFAVVVDMAPFVLSPWLSAGMRTVLTRTETTGELGVMTLVLIAAHHMTRSRTAAASGQPLPAAPPRD